MADDRRIVYSISVNPQEGLQDENLNTHWIPDSDIKVALGGSNTLDINSIQTDIWYQNEIQVETSGMYPGLGQEKITSSVNSTFISSGDWVTIGGATLTIPHTGDLMRIVTDGNSTGDVGAQLASTKFSSIEASKVYRVTADLDNTAGATTPQVKFEIGGASALVKATDGDPSNGTINTVAQEYYADITTSNDSGDLKIYRPAANDSGTSTITVDNVSVKELPVIEFFYIKNNSSGSDSVLVSFDKTEAVPTYLVKVPPGEAFACRLNNLNANNLHIKSSANIVSVECLAAKAE